MAVKKDDDHARLADVETLRDVQQHARVAVAFVLERRGAAAARTFAAVERERRVLELDQLGLGFRRNR
jgi:hypothetical protein